MSRQKNSPLSKKQDKFYFDEEAADHAQWFVETFCSITKGGSAGEPMILSDWQRDEIIRPAFGWKRKSTEKRRYKYVYLEVPRKNSKTHLAAAVALYMLMGDGEKTPEVITAAADETQARICYQIASMMVSNSNELSQWAKAQQRAIYTDFNNGSFKAISHESKTKHGLDTSALIVDELHAHKNTELYDTLKTGVASRSEPMIFELTTAGVADRSNLGYQRHEYADQVLQGHVHDETLLPVVYGANKEDDPFDEKVWEKANPNLGVSVSKDYLKEEAQKAEYDDHQLQIFKRLHLNIWTNQTSVFINSEDFDKCDKGPVEVDENMDCYIGVDLSSTEDFTAIVCLFVGEEDYKVLPYFMIPEASVNKRIISDTIHVWNSKGYIEFSPGEVVDYREIYSLIKRIGSQYNVKEICYDPKSANRVIPDLVEEGFECVQVRQGWITIAPAMEEMKRLFKKAELSHGGNPILHWMNANLEPHIDPQGNVMPHKGQSRDKIDGMVALVMSIHRAIMAERETEEKPRIRII